VTAKKMFLLLGIPLIFGHLVLGCLFWSVVKAKARIDGTLKDSIASDNLVSALIDAGFFDKGAAEASDLTGKASHSTGEVWETLLASGAGYPAVISMEAESSSRSFKTPRNAFLALSILVFVVEYLFLPGIYIVISAFVFLLMSLTPLPESGARRASSELGALSWLIFHYYRSDPGECRKSLAKSSALKNLYEAIARLDPEYARGYEDMKDLDISPAVFREVYLRSPIRFPAAMGTQAPSYGPDIEKVVALLVDAGLGPGKSRRRRLTEPPPPIFWRKGATAANQLRAWLRQNASAAPNAHAAQARRVVDRTGLVPRYLR
jgi:hypothetical protein